MNSETPHSRRSLVSSLKSQPMRALSTSRLDKRQEQDSCRTKQVRSSRRRILSTSGICLKSICRSLMMALSGSTTINSSSCRLVCRLSAASSLARAHSSSLSEMNLVASRSSPSSITSSGRSICSRPASKSRSTTPADMATLRRRIWRTTSSS